MSRDEIGSLKRSKRFKFLWNKILSSLHAINWKPSSHLVTRTWSSRTWAATTHSISLISSRVLKNKLEHCWPINSTGVQEILYVFGAVCTDMWDLLVYDSRVPTITYSTYTSTVQYPLLYACWCPCFLLCHSFFIQSIKLDWLSYFFPLQCGPVQHLIWLFTLPSQQLSKFPIHNLFFNSHLPSILLLSTSWNSMWLKIHSSIRFDWNLLCSRHAAAARNSGINPWGC